MYKKKKKQKKKSTLWFQIHNALWDGIVKVVLLCIK